MEWSEIFSKPAVIWFFLGLALALLEFLAPGMIILFFGIGAWVTALSFLFFDPGINTQIIIFMVSSVLSILLLRKSLKKMFFNEDPNKKETLPDEFIGQSAVVETEINKDKPGSVSFKGANWEAMSDQKLKVGQRVQISAKESIKLHVEPKS